MIIREVDRRELKEMPYAHSFTISGNEELCNATGYEVAFSDNPTRYWNEYQDLDGELHYGN